MQQTQPTPTAPAPGASLAPVGSEISRMTAYALVGLAGSCLVMISSFLPWIGYGHHTWTGWEIFSHMDKGFFTANMFSYRFSPLVTGPSTLILGALAAATAVLVLRSPRQTLPGRYTVPLSLVAIATFAGVVLFVVPMVNLWSYWVYAQDMGYSFEFGSILLALGGFLVLLGLIRSTRGRFSMTRRWWQV